MLFKNLKVTTLAHSTRVSCDIVDQKENTAALFYEVSAVNGKQVANDYSPFLACMLPTAMTCSENLVIPGKISRRLLSGTSEFQNKFIEFYPHLKTVKINSRKNKDEYKPKKVGLFFSGGVDSFYSFLKNQQGEAEKITDFIFVVGFDIEVSNRGFAKRVEEQIREIADSQGISLVIVKTNLRLITDNFVDWDTQLGAALASIALLLRKRFKKVYIAGSSSTEELPIPYGSHPSLDHLWSTETLEVVHDGLEHTRNQRVAEFVAKSEVALDNLRVCWRNGAKACLNCGVCEKCIRTMLELEVAEVLHKAKTFPKPLNLKQVAKTRIVGDGYDLVYQDLLRGLENKPHGEKAALQKAIKQMLQNYRNPPLKERVTRLVGSLDHKHNQDRLFWFLSKKGMI